MAHSITNIDIFLLTLSALENKVLNKKRKKKKKNL